MKKLEFYNYGLIKQLKSSILMIKEPEKLVEEEKQLQGINITLVEVVFGLFMICKYKQLMDGKILSSIIGWGLSFILFGVYHWVLIKTSSGTIKIDKIINFSLYMHIIYVFINMFNMNHLFSLLVYGIGHFYAIRFQLVAVEGWFDCRLEKVKFFFYIQIGMIVCAAFNNGLVYIGNHMVYSEKLLYFPLLG